MTPSQLRRLAALVVKPAPCLGCCQEELRDAREKLAERFPETSIGWSLLNKLRAFLGQDPEPSPSDEELEHARAAAQADVERATAAIQTVMRVPPHSRKHFCPRCESRKRSRRKAQALAEQVERNQRALKREQGGE